MYVYEYEKDIACRYKLLGDWWLKVPCDLRDLNKFSLCIEDKSNKNSTVSYFRDYNWNDAPKIIKRLAMEKIEEDVLNSAKTRFEKYILKMRLKFFKWFKRWV